MRERWPQRSTIVSYPVRSWPRWSRTSRCSRRPKRPDVIVWSCTKVTGCWPCSQIRLIPPCEAGWKFDSQGRSNGPSPPERSSPVSLRDGRRHYARSTPYCLQRSGVRRTSRASTASLMFRSARMPAQSCGSCTPPFTTPCAPGPATSILKQPQRGSSFDIAWMEFWRTSQQFRASNCRSK